MLKRLITWLVARYNKNESIEDQIEIVKPTIFQASQTASISKDLYKNVPAFFENIIKEKKYDLSVELMNQIIKHGFMKETIEYREKETFIKIEIKTFSYE